MAASPSSTPNPSAGGMTESEAVMRLFGADPWMRFDLWSNRAWEAAQGAIAVAAANGPSMSSDESLDHRIVTFFHAAEVAKEFSEMVNPLIAVSGVRSDDDSDTTEPSDLTIGMIIDTEEQG